jgi:hypothetical protein
MVRLAASSLSCVPQRLQGHRGYIPVNYARHHKDHIFLRQQPAMLR